MANSFGSRSTLKVGSGEYTIYRLAEVEKLFPEAKKSPFSLKVLLERLLRTENGLSVSKKDIEALAQWDPAKEPETEIAFTPARVLMQDFTGVPAVVDLAAMRDAMAAMGGDPTKINPLQPAELVIDHSVQVDEYGSVDSFKHNVEIEYQRNEERYLFLRWGQTAFDNFKVVPPGTGICHQVNLEYLARAVFVNAATNTAYPDTLVGTDSHTTMVNGLGVLGWGVGGIEAEAAMLGQPVTMLIPQVIGFRLHGKLPPAATATDLVLTVTQMLRARGVVGKFVEFFGAGLAALPLEDRATIANMAPEYGATCGIFPVDAETLRYLRTTGRGEIQISLVEAYYREQGMFHDTGTEAANYTEVMELDLGTVEPSLAGPARPQDRVRLSDVKSSFLTVLPKLLAAAKGKTVALEMEAPPPPVASDEAAGKVTNGSVVIAAITSCTNTSNPSVMLAAGVVARNAVAKGLQSQPWVKTSLAPGSKVATDYFNESGLMKDLDALGFNVVGYGCATCIGNSGPLPAAISKKINDDKLVAAAVLSGNRNFEGRIHADVRANYLASPPLVVAYALAGRVDIDWQTEPVGTGTDGNPVFLKDIWPKPEEVQSLIRKYVKREQFEHIYADVYLGDESWQLLKIPEGNRYAWDDSSTYVKNPPYFDGMTLTPPPVTDIRDARVLAVLGDSITTDHISPAGAIKKNGPAGKYLMEKGVPEAEFNSFGARRGNHEVMMRGTFANVRLKNKLVEPKEGGLTKYLPTGEEMSIFDASMKYQEAGTPLVILAGKEYGSGSSRDWAAKGTKLLGVRAVIAESFERIHRSNLIGMGVLPLQFVGGHSVNVLNLTGNEPFTIAGVEAALQSVGSGKVELTVEIGDGKSFKALLRIDTPQEVLYYQHGGILPYVLRQLLAKA